MAQHRHKRETNARRFPRAALVAAPFAVVATLSTVGAGVLAGSVGPAATDPANLAGSDLSTLLAHRDTPVSRSLSRQQLRMDARVLDKRAANFDRRQDSVELATTRSIVALAVKKDVSWWTTAPLDLWSSAEDDARGFGELAEGAEVLVTGRQANGRVELVVKGEARWVTEGYLTDEKPIAAAAGLSMEPCPDTAVEHGLTRNAVYVYRSVCHAFPQITRYGGWDNHGEHASGRALDIMTSDVQLGTAIAEFLRAHASELHLYDVIWRQHIWTPERAGEGWRSMPSRGSITANHYDHVHVSTY